jgi:hypothetical protein
LPHVVEKERKKLDRNPKEKENIKRKQKEKKLKMK